MKHVVFHYETFECFIMGYGGKGKIDFGIGKFYGDYPSPCQDFDIPKHEEGRGKCLI